MVTIAVTSESADEPRVAVSPDTVEKVHRARRATFASNRAPGCRSRFLRRGLPCGRGRDRQPGEALSGADILLAVRRPSAEDIAALEARRHRRRNGRSLRRSRGACGARRNRRHGFLDGVDAADDARPIDGRAVEPGEPRGLQGRRRRRRDVRPGAADDDDAGRYGSGGEGLHHGRRRCGSAGHRDGAAARRAGDRDGRASGDEGAGAVARRQVHRGRGRRIQAGADGGRIRQADERRISGEAGRTCRAAHQDAGYRHHDGAHSRPSGAEAHLACHDRKHEARLGDRRSRGRTRRQHGADGARQDRSRRRTASRFSGRSISPARSRSMRRASMPATFWRSSKR